MYLSPRSWAEYKDGFGDMQAQLGEFWLGNENLHHITAQGKHAASENCFLILIMGQLIICNRKPEQRLCTEGFFLFFFFFCFLIYYRVN